MSRPVIKWLLATAMFTLSSISAHAQEKLSVRLDFSPWGIHAAMHLAQDKGWFRQAGLDVDIQDGRGSGNTLQLVNSGRVDVGQVQLGLLPQARANGASVISIACWGRRTDLGVLVDRNSQIKKVQDFENKTIAVFAASPWAPLIDYWLKQGNLDRTKVNVLFVDASALWGIYTSGRADGLMSTAPSVEPVAEAVRPSRTVLAEDVGITYPSYGLIVADQTVETRKAALKTLVSVEQRAWSYIRDGHYEEAADAIMRQRPDVKLDRTVLIEQIRKSVDFFDTPATKGKPIGWQADEDWVKALNTMQAAGVIKPGWKTSDYYTNQFINLK
ncbi:myristoyl transferase [Bordetella genomosp. 10]|uniref:Myristoyl transferase n=1 Tax=Bordetella genomosp. 10 TaxID=1416804 RepID=A0A261S1E0_9BORD|nr:ABC transporter substrate-binding protein [Bordetella genomosp. 10]OZI31148.1 myristoyl transferase [Bordetella genomosp. 10]